jgi:serine/threonine protein kinase
MSRTMPLYSVVSGKYILGQIIGKGSFGEVYLATV